MLALPVAAALLVSSVRLAAARAPDGEAYPGVRAALARSLAWLDTHPAGPDAKLGSRVLDAWAWERYARLHPDPAVRERAAREARARLASLEIEGQIDFVALSYWATALRCRHSLGLATEPLARRLAELDLPRLLDEGSPSTGWWSGELLRRSEVEVATSARATALAASAADPAWTPSVRDAVAFYHEIAAASDLGRAPVRGLSPQALTFARGAHPALFSLARERNETDAAAEVLIGAAILGQRDEAWFREGVLWLVGRQRGDGTYPRASARPSRSVSDSRHGVLVVSWALLEFASDRERRPHSSR